MRTIRYASFRGIVLCFASVLSAQSDTKPVTIGNAQFYLREDRDQVNTSLARAGMKIEIEASPIGSWFVPVYFLNHNRYIPALTASTFYRVLVSCKVGNVQKTACMQGGLVFQNGRVAGIAATAVFAEKTTSDFDILRYLSLLDEGSCTLQKNTTTSNDYVVRDVFIGCGSATLAIVRQIPIGLASSFTDADVYLYNVDPLSKLQLF